MHEVVSGVFVEQFQYLAQRGFGGRIVAGGALRRFLDRRQRDAAFIAQHFEQTRGHLGDRQNPIHHAGFDGVARHFVELRLVRLLRQGEAAALFDALDSGGAVGIGARQNNADGARFLRFGQSAKEQIHRHAAPRFALQHRQFDVGVFHRKQVSGRNHVNMVDFDGLILRDLNHRHLRHLAQNRNHVALVIGRQMQNHHESHAAIVGHFAEEGLQRADGARRTAQPDNGKFAVFQRQNFGIAGRLTMRSFDVKVGGGRLEIGF